MSIVARFLNRHRRQFEACLGLCPCTSFDDAVDEALALFDDEPLPLDEFDPLTAWGIEA